MSLKEKGYDISASLKDALHPTSIAMKLLIGFVFAVVLAHKVLISNLDKWGQSGSGAVGFFLAIWLAIKEGSNIALGSIWVVISNPVSYFDNQSWGSIIFAVIMIIALIGFFYQGVSFFINVVDGVRGQATSFLLRFSSTIIFVILLSAFVYYTGGHGDIVTSVIANNNTISDSINQTIINTTTSGNTSVISLL